MITDNKNLNNNVIIISLIDVKISEITKTSLSNSQLKNSFFVSILWTVWIYLWFFHFRFNSLFNPRYNIFEEPNLFIFQYFFSLFILYSILYFPQNSHNTDLSIQYMFKVFFFHSINVIVLMLVITFLDHFLVIILILFLNFFIIWKVKYTQLNYWEKFKSTIKLTKENELYIKKNKIKLIIFVFSGVFSFYLIEFNLRDDFLYFIIFFVMQILFYVGYSLCISENRKWIDRFFDFLALLFFNFIIFVLKFMLLSYIKMYISFDKLSLIFALILEFFYVYVFYSFSSRTFLADFALNLHKKPTLFNETSRKPKSIEKEQIYCPKCGNKIEQLESLINKEDLTFYCPFCGEKMKRYELLYLSEAELILKHQKILQKLDNKNEIDTHLS